MTQPSPFVSALVVLLVAGSALAMSTFATLPAQAQQKEQEKQKEYALSNYDVTVDLRNGGAIDVRETIRLDVRAGSFTSMYREVEMSRLDSLTDVTVTSDDVSLDEVSVVQEDGDTMIRWRFPEQSVPASFTLQYRAHGGLRVDGPDNVLHWTAVGMGWEVPVSSIDISLGLPASLRISRDELSLTPAPASLQENGGGWTARFAPATLEAGQGMSVKASFPKRIDAPEMIDGLDILKGLGWGCILFAGFFVAYLRRSSRPSVDKGRTSDNSASDSPPMSLPEAARMLGDSRSARMHGALLFDLARRGHITLQAASPSGWFAGSTRMELDVHPDRFDLTPFEEAFLDELAELDDLGELQTIDSFRRDQRTHIRKRLQEQGLLYDRTSAYRRFVLMSVGSMILGVVISIWALIDHIPDALYPVASLIGVSMGSALFIGQPYAPTERGRQVRADVEAFIDEKKTRMEMLRDEDPQAATRRLPDELPWLILSPSVSSTWFQKLENAVDDAGYGDILPTWIRPCTDESTDMSGIHLYVVALMLAGDAGMGGSAGGATVSGGVAGAGAGGAGGGGGGAA